MAIIPRTGRKGHKAGVCKTGYLRMGSKLLCVPADGHGAGWLQNWGLRLSSWIQLFLQESTTVTREGMLLLGKEQGKSKKQQVLVSPAWHSPTTSHFGNICGRTCGSQPSNPEEPEWESVALLGRHGSSAPYRQQNLQILKSSA